ncbi:hypothetical protein F4777DRAFT_24675 [Nemania sp. FL0916]|nr:hypothetical protein F4777DRAFT_24675 [Nemania sp. FL0916]
MEDYFSDDDLDALNANALQELENHAIQFTQAQKAHEQAVAADSFDDDDLDDAVLVVQDALQPKHALPPAPVKPAALPSRIPPQPSQLQHPQQQPQRPQNETWRPMAMAVPASRLRPGPFGAGLQPPSGPRGPALVAPHASQSIPRPPPSLPRPAPSTTTRYQPSQNQNQSRVSQDIAALQAQILDLKSKLTTKDGEISIVRNRLEKSREDHERQLQLIKAQTAEQLAKQERAVEAAKAAQESAATELEFTRRDLREEAVRAKRQDGPKTPKKNPVAKTWGVADGFEDVEMAASPGKGKRGKNAGAVAGSVVEPPALKLLKTPTKNKRKRPALNSPVMALETHSDDAVMLDGVGAHDAAVVSPLPPVPYGSVPFNYVNVMLNHSAGRGRPLTFEFLSRFTLRSRPDESIASILLRKLSTASNSGDPTQVPIQFCLEVIRLWDACMHEHCLAPIIELVSLVSFTLQLQTVALAPYIAPTLLPVAMEACYQVAIPRFNNVAPADGDPTTKEFTEFRDNIDTNKILSLLYLTALGCATSDPVGGSISSPSVDFWSQVHIQFILMLLTQKQPLGDFMATLRLLCTSVFPDSIGPINPDKAPDVVARLLIDRVSTHLTETLRWEADEMKVREVRLAVLQTLSTFARSPFGLTHLVKHDWVIPRLVTFLASCIEELYDGDMQYSLASEDEIRDEFKDGLQRLVAHTMLLLHLVVTTPLDGQPIDVSAKLAKTTGGSQKYLVSLSRLNFADDLVSEDTAELAHELLELAVTSEAGEELGEFFGS